MCAQMLISRCVGVEHMAGAEWKWVGKSGRGVLGRRDAKEPDTDGQRGGGEAGVKPHSTELSAPLCIPLMGGTQKT